MSGPEEADVYSGILKHLDEDVQFALTSSEFRWWPKELSEEGCLNIPAANIISVTSSYDGDNEGGILKVCFAQRHKPMELKRVMECFYGTIAVCNACAERLQQYISEDTRRPRRTLVIISSVSGRCKGQQLYEDIVAPLFKEAGIQTDVKKTKRHRHASEIISKYDIATVDSIVVVAGDGTYGEVIDSLLRNHCSTRADDTNEPSEVGIPIGIIPTGTGNVLACRCYGTIDVETAALTIISGKRKRTGAFGVYSEGRLITYAGLSVAYGVFGDFMYLVSSKRNRTGYFSIPLAYYRMLSYFLFGEIRDMDMTVRYARPVSPNDTIETPTSAKTSAPPPDVTDGSSETPTSAKTSAPPPDVTDGSSETPTSANTSAPPPDVTDGSSETPTSAKTSAPPPDVTDGSSETPTSAKTSAPPPDVTDGSSETPTSTNTSAPPPDVTDGSSETPTSAKTSAPPPDVTDGSSETPTSAKTSATPHDVTDGNSRDRENGGSDGLEWITKTGLYNGVTAAFTYDTFAFYSTEGIQPGCVTRLMLYKASSRWQLIKSIYHSLTFNTAGMTTDGNIDHDLAREYIVKLNKASDASAEREQKELRLCIDGDIVDLPAVPEFHVKLLSDKVELFCNV